MKREETYAWRWTQGLEVQLDKLIDTRNICRDLYFLLHFDLVNKLYFQLLEISLCAYVGLKLFVTKNGPQGSKDHEALL